MFPNEPFPIIHVILVLFLAPLVIEQIFVPLVAFVIIILCCTSLCKTLQRVHREHLESQAQARSLEARERPSVFVIPITPPDEDLHRPPHYNTVDHYSPPPAYHELELKPDFIPDGPPPAYSESISSPHIYSPPAEFSVISPAQSHPSARSEPL